MASPEADSSQWPKKRNVHQNVQDDSNDKDDAEDTRKQTKFYVPNSDTNNAASDLDKDTGTKATVYSQGLDNDNEYHQKDATGSEHNENKPETPEGKRQVQSLGTCYVPKRVIVTVLLGLGMLLVYAMRTNVGVLVVMILDKNAYEKVGSNAAKLNLPQVSWDSRMVGFLHSVFYIGYLISHIPAAFIVSIWPCNRIYGGCILISSLLNLLLPLAIGGESYVITCIIRACQGLAEGMLYPSCYGVLRNWTAPRERSRQVSAVLSCAYAGLILGFPMAGFISHYLAWSYIFYVSGSVCVIWYIFWLFLAYDKPSHHAHISDSEFDFLQNSQGHDVIDYENVVVPWRSIMTSFPVIAIGLCHFVFYWDVVLMLTNEALYLNQFGFNIAQTGVLSSFPHIGKLIVSFASGIMADGLLNSHYMSTTAVRKLLTVSGFSIQAVCFLVLTFLEKGTAVIIVLTIAISAFGLTTSGWSVNHYDLSTRHASSLVAVTSTAGSIGAIIVPLATGELTLHQDLQSWDNVFYLTSGIVLVATVFYCIFGSGEQQPWSDPPSHICLIQKTDPLARKPYSTQHLQGNKSGELNTMFPYKPCSPNTSVSELQSSSSKKSPSALAESLEKSLLDDSAIDK